MATWSCRRATGRWCWWRRRRRRIRSAGWCERRSRRSPDEPVRVLATTNRQRPSEPLPPAPANAVVVDWLSYSQAMAAADLVICHGGHGTVARALGAGVPALCCPAVGDMAENGARVAWSGAGLMLPWRLMTPATLRLTVRRLLGERLVRRRGRREIAAWSRENDGARAGGRAGRGAARDRDLKSSRGGIRTHNRRVNSALLRQLSYPGLHDRVIGDLPPRI